MSVRRMPSGVANLNTQPWWTWRTSSKPAFLMRASISSRTAVLAPSSSAGMGRAVAGSLIWYGGLTVSLPDGLEAVPVERKWWTLIAVNIATFMLLLDITVVNTALPAIQ